MPSIPMFYDNLSTASLVAGHVILIGFEFYSTQLIHGEYLFNTLLRS